MKYSNIKKQVSNIQDSISILSNYEIENYLYSLSFDYDFIKACSDKPSLDDMLLEAISEAHNGCNTVYDTLQSMIEILA